MRENEAGAVMTHDNQDEEPDKPRHLSADGQAIPGTEGLRDDLIETANNVSIEE